MTRVSVAMATWNGARHVREQLESFAAQRRQPDQLVVCDDASLDLIGGSRLDWVESLGGAAFQLTNPNATAQCGCGASFSV